MTTTSTADLWDDHGDRLSSLTTQFRDFGGEIAFSGPARTVRCLEDNVVLATLLETPGDGAVLVVDGGGSLACALMGDRIAGLAVVIYLVFVRQSGHGERERIRL